MASGGALFDSPPVVVAPGAVHLPQWLEAARCRELVAACRAWARGPVGMEHHRTRGGRLSVKMASLGWYWRPYRYSPVRPDGAPVRAFPPLLGDLARAALRDAAAVERHLAAEPSDPGFDVALVNYYNGAATMGMHQDRDEHSRAPVVSLSLGDSCVFRFGNTKTRGRPYADVELRGGDAFVFGGPSRLAYHGVPRTLPGTADAAGGLGQGRLNITVRATGFPQTSGNPDADL